MLTDCDLLLNEYDIHVSYNINLSADGDIKGGNIISETINPSGLKLETSEDTALNSVLKSEHFDDDCISPKNPLENTSTDSFKISSETSVHKEESPEIDEKTVVCSEQNSSTIWCCLICQQAFDNLQLLFSHIQLSHSCLPQLQSALQTNVNLVCKLCQKQFLSNWSYKKHLKLHYPPYEFCCKTCGKTFGKSFNLWRHQITHTNERPFVCRSCGLSYRDPSALKKHQKKYHS